MKSQISDSKSQISRRRRRQRWLRRALVALVAIPAVAWGIFAAAVAWWPYPTELAAPPPAATMIDDRRGQPLVTLAASDGMLHFPITEAQAGPYLAKAIVAVEDARFYKHHGVDWRAVLAAAWQDARSLCVRRGASTLPMQLHHLRDPRPRTCWNKLEQAVRGEQIDRRMSKAAILLEYLNRAPFGGSLVGAGAASWRYFGKPCERLSLAQAALLAGLPQSPNRYRPDRHPDRALARRDHVLDRMLACALIGQAEHDRAVAEPLEVTIQALPQGNSRELAMGALPTLINAIGGQAGRRLRVTIDADVQRAAYAMATEHLARLDAGTDAAAAAVVVLDTTTAECLAAVSLGGSSPGVDFVNAPRSIGSVLKPFIYATAFDDGICGPRTMVSDAPAAWAGYEPRNFDQSFRGQLTAAEALAQSRNLPAMELLARVGVKHVARVLHDAGLHSLSPDAHRYGLTLAVGGVEASPMEVAEAYACLGRGGTARRASLQCREPSTSPATPLRPPACAAVLAALCGHERTAALCDDATRLGVAWKTGTSSGQRDAWCAALTPRRVVVVWVGRPQGHGDAALKGIDAAAPLALRLIAAIDRGGERWAPPMPRPATADEPAAAEAEMPGRVSIVTPANGQQIVLSPEEPPQRQKVLVKAKVTLAEKRLFWFVDGEPVDLPADDPASLWWRPCYGRHVIKVVSDRGDSATVIVHVVEATNAPPVE